jgi:hypothetical protein
MSAELFNDKGPCACGEQAISINRAEVLGGNVWSCVRNNGNNAWYVNMGNGNLNNNNTNNTYSVVPASDLSEKVPAWIAAESDCYKNKHASLEAASFHFNLSRIYELINRIDNGYQPQTSICFVLDYPVYREVFAANYTDRIVHHYVAPMLGEICEKVHEANGDVSHGNRIGHSASTAIEQIQRNIRDVTDGYTKKAFVATMDISGFFMSIDKETAYRILRKYADMYYDKPDKEEKLSLLHTLIQHNPATDCERRSDIKMWDKVPPNKSLFGLPPDKGLPIGNFYSQLLANLVMTEADAKMIKTGVRYTRFVDDICVVAETAAEIIHARKVFIKVAERLKLKVHPDKFYIQPASHGVKFCGKVVKLNRIYISNRIVHALHTAIEEYSRMPSYDNAVHAMQSINSYFGLMKGTASFNIKKRIAKKALEKFSEWLYFRNKNGRFICVLKSKYKPNKTSYLNQNDYASIFRPPERYYPKRRLPLQLREPAYLRA